MKLFAFDTETFLIANREQHEQHATKINVSPYQTPKIVLGSYAANFFAKPTAVTTPIGMRDTLRDMLRAPDVHIVCHHLPFDLDVVCTAFPELWPLFRVALENNRCHDTKVFDLLLRLASGWYDRPDPANNWALPEVKVRSLDELTQTYLHRVTPKDLKDDQGDLVRLSFGKFDGVPIEQLPRIYYDYALSDSVATLELFERMLKDAPADMLGEPAQTRAEVAMYSFDKIGLRIDRNEARRLYQLFMQDIPPLDLLLRKEGLGEFLPLKGTINKRKIECPPDTMTTLFGTSAPRRDSSPTEESLPPAVGSGQALPTGEDTASSLSEDSSCAPIGSPSESSLEDSRTTSISVTPATTLAVSIQSTSTPETLRTTLLTVLPETDGLFEKVLSILVTGTVGTWVSPDARHASRVRRFKSHFVVEEARAAFHLHQNEIRSRLLEFARQNHIPYKKTPGGDLSLTAEDWKDVLPADREDFTAWLKKERLKKIISTYLDLYSRVDYVYPRARALGARSGRTSYAAPNCQNVPKRKHGIRSLFIPHEGYVFVVADYSFQELVTLAQAMLDMGIKGPLYDAIQIGDPHTTTAALLMGVDPKTIGKKSPERQAAKAVNFGVPGGLGPVKLADYARKEYGTIWTLDQAREMRKRFLDVYPDIAEFLNRHRTSMDKNLIRASGRGITYWKAKLNARDVMHLRQIMSTSDDPRVRTTFYEAERSLTVRLRTGLVRKGCTFTEGSNTNFQGLAAAVSKEANWLFFANDRAREIGARPVLIVHDEIVAEVPPEHVAECKLLLEKCMISAFCTTCPDVGHFAKVEVEGPLTKWGRATDKEGKAI